MAKCFQESHEAYARGDGALAKELSNQGKEHQKQMERLNQSASDFIFIGSFTAIQFIFLTTDFLPSENNKVSNLKDLLPRFQDVDSTV